MNDREEKWLQLFFSLPWLRWINFLSYGDDFFFSFFFFCVCFPNRFAIKLCLVENVRIKPNFVVVSLFSSPAPPHHLFFHYFTSYHFPFLNFQFSKPILMQFLSKTLFFIFLFYLSISFWSLSLFFSSPWRQNSKNNAFNKVGKGFKKKTFFSGPVKGFYCLATKRISNFFSALTATLINTKQKQTVRPTPVVF